MQKHERCTRMHGKMESAPIWLAAAMVLLAMAAGCGGLQVASIFRTEPVSVDGQPTEWRGLTTYVQNPNASIGVMNDDEYVYLCFSTPLKAAAAQIARDGLTIWFDAGGGKNKQFGIRFPVPPVRGMAAGGAPEEAHGGRPRGAPTAGVPSAPDSSAMRGRSGGDRGSADVLLRELSGAPREIEIRGPGKDDRRAVPEADWQGIEVRLGDRDGRLVYEMKVPLTQGDAHPFAIGAKAGQKIGIGFETAGLPSGSLPERGPGDGEMPGGPPGGGGGPGGDRGQGPGPMGGRGRPRSDMGALPEQLEIWCKASLASSGAVGGVQ